MNLLAYCRPGFEAECAQELQAWVASRGAAGYARAQRDAAFARFAVHDGERAAPREAPHWRELMFARQVLREVAELRDLPPKDRLTPIVEALKAAKVVAHDVWVETPDSTAGAELRGLCRSFEAAALPGLRRAGIVRTDAPLRLHLTFLAGDHALVSLADPDAASPWRDGVPRLKLPREAPSRSALKIEEAWLTLLDEDERRRWLAPGLTAVDLGAAPGGWTWQLARKSIRVVAVDNGPLRDNVLATGIVEHVRADGFRYRPKKRVDWVVCDMVEQPARVAALIGDWLVAGDARAALFNLKLPMKKRWQETVSCLDGLRSRLAEVGGNGRWDVRARQLYHDREEITAVALPG